jgi:lipoic acid synthetase
LLKYQYVAIMSMSNQQLEIYQRKPEWLKISLSHGPHFKEVATNLRAGTLTTVCEEARCPNLHECWGQQKTATYMILGDTCTRRCRFCAVKTGTPGCPDPAEAQRVAYSARDMDLKHVVVTMVTRDDLADGGASHLADTVSALRQIHPKATIEVLSSDLMGKLDSIQCLVDSVPEILSHNLETVRRLTPSVRSRSDYDRSLAFLAYCSKNSKGSLVKSSLMLGLGEEEAEIHQAIEDLRQVGVQVINMGQYLQPSRTNLRVEKYWSPEEFARLKSYALAKGFSHVEAGPLVRSSYHAGGQYELIRQLNHPLFKEKNS